MIRPMKDEGTMLTANDVQEAILKWPCRYELPSGRKVIGLPVSQISQHLRDHGWKNVPRLDSRDLKKLGLEIVVARYTSGARPKRFCDVVVAKDI